MWESKKYYEDRKWITLAKSLDDVRMALEKREVRRRKRQEKAIEEPLSLLEEKAKAGEKKCKDCAISVSISSWAKSDVRYPLENPWETTQEPVSTRDGVAKALHMLLASICPHLTLNSPPVLEAYSLACQHLEFSFLHSGQSCSSPSDECHLCYAKFMFRFERIDDRPRVLHLVVDRSFSPMGGITDPAWMVQLVPQNTFRSSASTWVRSFPG